MCACTFGRRAVYGSQNISSWSTSVRYSYRTYQSPLKTELACLCPRRGCLSYEPVNGAPLWELVTRDELRSVATGRCLADYVLGFEMINLAEIQRCLQLAPSAVTTQVNTDGIMAWMHQKHAQRVKDAVLAQKYTDGSQRFALKCPMSSALRAPVAGGSGVPQTGTGLGGIRRH